MDIYQYPFLIDGDKTQAHGGLKILIICRCIIFNTLRSEVQSFNHKNLASSRSGNANVDR